MRLRTALALGGAVFRACALRVLGTSAFGLRDEALELLHVRLRIALHFVRQCFTPAEREALSSEFQPSASAMRR